MVVTRSPEWFVKIADFGTSKRRQEGVSSLRTLHQGTIGYAAPEVLGISHGQGQASYTSSVDMWSLGVMTYRILTNNIPFPGMTDLFQYVSGNSCFPTQALVTHDISETGQHFIAELMGPRPGDRLIAASAMSHPWLTCPVDETDW